MPNTAISPQFSLKKSIPPLGTLLTALILIFLAWAFFSKQTMHFYASFLFLFYSFTKSMWISVVMLGIFQTLIMVPFRLINQTKSKNIKEFEGKINEKESENEQSFLIKKSAKSGQKVFLYYLVDFFFALTSYVSMGRLFLTDFYTKKLGPEMLYSFVPYPDYPLLDVWFKIPYIRIVETKDFGFQAVIIAAIVIVLLSILITWGKGYIKKQTAGNKLKIAAPIRSFIGLFSTSVALLVILSYVILRHFPTAFQFAIFTGDISKPNPPFNTITALATAFTIMWLDIPVILKKVQLARDSGVDPKIIKQTQTQLFSETLRSAILVGLGAYFITNRIPCAFELSIFTLEIISWLSPLTIDKLILRNHTPVPILNTPLSPPEPLSS